MCTLFLHNYDTNKNQDEIKSSKEHTKKQTQGFTKSSNNNAHVPSEANAFESRGNQKGYLPFPNCLVKFSGETGQADPVLASPTKDQKM